MRSFIISVLAGIAAAEYQNFKVNVDGSIKKYFVESKDFSTVEMANDDYIMNLRNNNSLLIKKNDIAGTSGAFKPYLRGGSITFNVNVQHMECGCVAGLYLAKVNDSQCGEDPTDDKPQCQSVDIFQGSKYGFSGGMHPCANGTCDAISQCQFDMRTQGEARYGVDAYGPGGTIIDTDQQFNVKTAFVCEKNYGDLWSLQTILTQGTRTMEMNAYCPGYIDSLSNPLDGQMGIIVSSWDNRNKRGADTADFETKHTCPESANSCASAMAVISELKIKQWGEDRDPKEPDGWPYTDPRPEPEGGNEEEDGDNGNDHDYNVTPLPPTPPEPLPPQPVPAEWEPFIVDSQLKNGITTMYFKGQDDRDLTTEGAQITMGHDNYGFIHDFKEDNPLIYAYRDNYLGGSFQYDVDVSAVSCSCAVRMQLRQVDGNCGEASAQFGADPDCTHIELMESNIWGFNQKIKTCNSTGGCDVSQNHQRKAEDVEDWAFGPGNNFTIDSNRSFTVKHEFWTMAEEIDSVLDYTELYEIKTTLIQDASSFTMTNSVADLAYLTTSLDTYALSIATYDVGQNNDLAQTSCTSTCDNSQVKLKNFVWRDDDSFVEKEVDPGQLIIDGVASSLNLCHGHCSECHEAHYENIPDEIVYQCIDTSQYKYGNVCDNSDPNWSTAKCMTASSSKCHKSYPYGDADKMNSPDATCRTIPDSYQTTDLTFGKQDCVSPVGGMCHYGCDGTCKQSWIRGDVGGWRSASNMCRCRAN